MTRRLFTLLLLFIMPVCVLFADEIMHVSYGKVSVDLPAGWLAQSLSDATVVFVFYSPEEMNDEFRERITITSGERDEELKDNLVIHDLKSNFLDFYDDYEILSEGFNNIIIEGDLGGFRVKQYIKFIIKKKRAYCITATALPDTYDDWEIVFKDIIKSIKIKN